MTNSSENSREAATAAATTRPAGRTGRALLLVLSLVLVILALLSSCVFVDETEYVIVERFGNIVAVYDRDHDRGLQWKLPWPIDSVRRFDRRVQLFDPPGREVFTRDKKNITVDVFLCWRIAVPEPTAEEAPAAPLVESPVVRFFRALGSPEVAEARLDSRVRSIITTRIGQVDLSELLSVEDSQVGPDEQQASLLDALSQDVLREVQRRRDEQSSLEQLGIELVDLRLKRINLPLGNQQAVFERMRSERQKIADRYRSAGMAENTVIRSRADRQYEEILARARADAERIRGEGEAEAIAVLNEAHALDPEFYKVLRTLDAYRKIINDRTTLVLSADSPLFELLTQGVPQLDDVTGPAADPQPPRQSSTEEVPDAAAGPSPETGRPTTNPAAASTDRTDVEGTP